MLFRSRQRQGTVRLPIFMERRFTGVIRAGPPSFPDPDFLGVCWCKGDFRDTALMISRGRFPQFPRNPREPVRAMLGFKTDASAR